MFFSSLTVESKEGHAADDEDGTDDDSGHADVELGGEVVLVVGGHLLAEALDPADGQEVGGEDCLGGAEEAGQGQEARESKHDEVWGRMENKARPIRSRDGG